MNMEDGVCYVPVTWIAPTSSNMSLLEFFPNIYYEIASLGCTLNLTCKETHTKEKERAHWELMMSVQMIYTVLVMKL